jgi:hypothetical protein
LVLSRRVDVLAPYLPRVVDDEIDELFGAVAAIALEGPKGVGKTRTALERANTVCLWARGDDDSVKQAVPEFVRQPRQLFGVLAAAKTESPWSRSHYWARDDDRQPPGRSLARGRSHAGYASNRKPAALRHRGT